MVPELELYAKNVMNANYFKAVSCPSLYCRFFLVLWGHGFHCGTLKLLEGH